MAAKVLAQSALLTSLTHGPSKEIEKSKRSVKMACGLQTPPVSRVRSFSGLRDSNYLDNNMVRSGQDFHSKVALSMSTISSRRGRRNRCVTKALFERFTEKGIKVIMLAQEESRRLGHNYIGTGQILLGLFSDSTGISGKVFESMGIEFEDARIEVENLIGKDSDFFAEDFPFTLRAKRVSELSSEAANELGHNYIGSEHLLLGLLRAGKGVADRVLEDLGVYPSDIHAQVLRMISEGNEVSVVTKGSIGKTTKMPTLRDGFGTKLTNRARKVRFEFEELHDRQMELRDQISAIHRTMNKVQMVEIELDIQDVVSSWYGIPIEEVSTEESLRLFKMEERLHERTIGNNDGLKTISRAIRRAIRRARAGLKNPHRPIASFIFSGPTGVGKSELAEALAAYFFGSEKAIIRLDTSELMESHIVLSKFIESVRWRPCTVVIFDKIEKAHPDVFNMILQILEDGRLTDNKGGTVVFNNTIVIMNSNVRMSVIEKGEQDMGFDLDENGNYYRIKCPMREELKQYYRPELLNRLDEVIVFK